MKPLHIFHLTPFDKTLLDYPRWMQLVPERPTPDQFYTAWIELYGVEFNNCLCYYGEYPYGIGYGLIVQISSKTIYDGFMDGDYTDCPVLGENDSFFYEGSGCTWGRDLIGQRYAKIDMATGHPVEFSKMKNRLIVMRSKIFQNIIRQ